MTAWLLGSILGAIPLHYWQKTRIRSHKASYCSRLYSFLPLHHTHLLVFYHLPQAFFNWSFVRLKIARFLVNITKLLFFYFLFRSNDDYDISQIIRFSVLTQSDAGWYFWCSGVCEKKLSFSNSSLLPSYAILLSLIAAVCSTVPRVSQIHSYLLLPLLEMKDGIAMSPPQLSLKLTWVGAVYLSVLNCKVQESSELYAYASYIYAWWIALR